MNGIPKEGKSCQNVIMKVGKFTSTLEAKIIENNPSKLDKNHKNIATIKPAKKAETQSHENYLITLLGFVTWKSPVRTSNAKGGELTHRIEY